MINRLFGTLCALAIIAVMVFAILNRGNYRSMCFEVRAKADVVVATPASEPEIIELPDSLSLQPGV
ncbi:MAG: hypothetical protein IKC12_02450 [Alistipes sp.]|nr:hypothetical protein [Alistipes sp.]